jgi:hypothetical protein
MIKDEYTNRISKNHECERVSLCCGAEANEYIEEFCGGCHEYTEFECLIDGCEIASDS